MRRTRSWSYAVPTTLTGRVCGTSASSAPNVTTSRTSYTATVSTITLQNVRHFNCGSLPTKKITSTLESGIVADDNVVDGHTISRCISSSSCTCGRVDVKSKNSSGSIVANGSASHRSDKNRVANVAAAPASFHPSNAATTTGFCKLG